MNVYDQEARDVRSRNLGLLNGLALVLVTLQPPVNPTQALLEVHFYNGNEVANILADIGGAGPERPSQIFSIFGGFRVSAGSGIGQVHVTGAVGGAATNVINLTASPIGDYSTYTLGVRFQNMDPLFNEIGFKFRPGCFKNDCAPEWCPAPPSLPEPDIDYLAKDFDSFKHTLIVAMEQRVPGWRPTSEADLDQVIIELFSAAADELSDYQDRVMNEAYLSTARERLSLARHARLMDYYIHEGNQASTWLALEFAPGTNTVLPTGLLAGTHGDPGQAQSQVFLTKEAGRVHELLNSIRLHTWSGAIPTLASGSTRADLALSAPSQANAQYVRYLIVDGEIRHLLVQEHLNPATGLISGRDPTKRQLLTLIPGSAEIIHDPNPLAPADVNQGSWVLRVRWREKLEHTYCFLINEPLVADDVALFHGNLVRAYHGRPHDMSFLHPDQPIIDPDRQRHYELAVPDDCRPEPDCGPDDPCRDEAATGRRRGVICRLPDEEPLLYRNTPPGGEIPSLSTLSLSVQPAGSLITDPWCERPDLIHSDDGSESGDHFTVETDEELRSLIRFGNGINGLELPEGATVHCTWQSGQPLAGNVGADTVNGLDDSLAPGLLAGATVWNPFDVTDGRDPEPASEIIRRVPEAYRARQLRAVTPADYVRRAEEVNGVARAAARYAWTGSWRTVQVAIDPVGTHTLEPELRQRVIRHLEAVRLIGEDLEIRPPVYVPLTIFVSLCVDAAYWPEDLRFVLEQELSDGYTPDGRKGFFRPDNLTFGQSLHASEIIGRILTVQGVDHVVSVVMRRWDAVTPGTADLITVRANEIIRVQNDPNHMEEGSIELDLQGGRR
jgi:hypothetical protein